MKIMLEHVEEVMGADWINGVSPEEGEDDKSEEMNIDLDTSDSDGDSATEEEHDQQKKSIANDKDCDRV